VPFQGWRDNLECRIRIPANFSHSLSEFSTPQNLSRASYRRGGYWDYKETLENAWSPSYQPITFTWSWTAGQDTQWITANLWPRHSLIGRLYHMLQVLEIQSSSSARPALHILLLQNVVKIKIAAGVFTQPYATQIGYGGARNRQSRQESKKKEDVTLEKIKWVHERVWLRAREIEVVQTDSKGRRRLKISYRVGTEACKSCHFGEEERRRGIPWRAEGMHRAL